VRERLAPSLSSMAPASKAEAEEALAEGMFKELRAQVRRGSDELRATIALEAWGEGGRPSRPLKRGELQILVEEAARTGRQLGLLAALAGALRDLGVRLDWAPGQDLAANLGRHALDPALEAAVNDNRDEKVALLLLDLGLDGGRGSAAQLNANPLLRAAASQGMVRLSERLVTDCGAAVNARDPRYGTTALDRAADAGQEAVARKLLDLGADPAAGRGVEYLAARLGPWFPARCSQASQGNARGGAQVSFEELRTSMLRATDDSAVSALDEWRSARGSPLRPAELALLLEDTARSGYRPAVLRRLLSELPFQPASAGDGVVGHRPLDAGLRAAVEENSDERVALLLLDLGIGSGGGPAAGQLNPNPLLRSAASRCLPGVVERLLDTAGADLDSPDPKFGSTALDRAVAAGCDEVATRLLERGADPRAGRGLDYLLQSASPRVSALLVGRRGGE